MKAYENICSYLDKCITFSKRSMEDFEKLLCSLGSPHKSLKCIHIAGTNAKGSTCSYVSSVLLSQGYKTALFTSPHLVKYNERIKINNTEISDEKLWEILLKIKSAQEGEEFSFFQIITAAALIWFSEEKVDYAVIETGLGGRLDATNVIEKPVMSVITNISKDHTNILGNTLEEIAEEKGGIIKKNSACLLYSNDKRVYNKIKEICRKKNSRLYYQKPDILLRQNDFKKCIFDFRLGSIVLKNVESGMSGEYQPYNAAGSIAVCLALKENGVDISRKAIYDGIRKAKINARSELVCENPYVIIDGAHNDEGTQSLGKFINNIKKNYKKNVILLMGMLSDKKDGSPFDNMAQYADKIVITGFKSKRALKSEQLFALTQYKEKCIFKSDDSLQSYEAARKFALENDYILVCAGSLYLMGELREHIFGGKND